MTENIPRVLPADTVALVDRNQWQPAAIFNWLQSAGNVSDSEMLKTFNCGIGMVLVVDAADADDVIQSLTAHGEQAWSIGVIAKSEGEAHVQYVNA